MMHILHWLAHAPWSVWYAIFHLLELDGGHFLISASHYGAVGLVGAGAVISKRRSRKRRKSVVNLEQFDDEERWQWWLVTDGGQPELVTRKKWVKAERAHGFLPNYKHDPAKFDAPATMSWSAGRSRGFRIRKQP
jgi:hypothetical protein